MRPGPPAFGGHSANATRGCMATRVAACFNEATLQGIEAATRPKSKGLHRVTPTAFPECPPRSPAPCALRRRLRDSYGNPSLALRSPVSRCSRWAFSKKGAVLEPSRRSISAPIMLRPMARVIEAAQPCIDDQADGIWFEFGRTGPHSVAGSVNRSPLSFTRVKQMGLAVFPNCLRVRLTVGSSPPTL
jgi:hypothetical protein